VVIAVVHRHMRTGMVPKTTTSIAVAHRHMRMAMAMARSITVAQVMNTVVRGQITAG
jgi:hypothetical protein